MTTLPPDASAETGASSADEHAWRYLVASGRRAIRGAARVQVDIPGQLSSETLRATNVRLRDLSSSGARISGARLASGSECELSFIPPGRRDAVRMRCLVVRQIENDEAGVTFCGATLSFRMDLSASAQTARVSSRR